MKRLPGRTAPRIALVTTLVTALVTTFTLVPAQASRLTVDAGVLQEFTWVNEPIPETDEVDPLPAASSSDSPTPLWPDYVGQVYWTEGSADQIATWRSTDGLEVAPGDHAESCVTDTAQEGIILEQDPAAGSIVDNGQRLLLSVGFLCPRAMSVP